MQNFATFECIGEYDFGVITKTNQLSLVFLAKLVKNLSLFKLYLLIPSQIFIGIFFFCKTFIIPCLISPCIFCMSKVC